MIKVIIRDVLDPNQDYDEVELPIPPTQSLLIQKTYMDRVRYYKVVYIKAEHKSDKVIAICEVL